MSDFLIILGARLRDERKRLGFNQENFGAIGGVNKGTQISYEQGKRAPDVTYLNAVSAVGVDLFYVMSGQLAPATLSPEETEFLKGFRSLDIRGKAGVLGLMDGMSLQAKPTVAPVFHGDVGQNVYGNTEAPNMITMPKKGKKK